MFLLAITCFFFVGLEKKSSVSFHEMFIVLIYHGINERRTMGFILMVIHSVLFYWIYFAYIFVLEKCNVLEMLKANAMYKGISSVGTLVFSEISAGYRLRVLIKLIESF